MIGIGGSSSGYNPDARYLSMLYFFHYNLPNAWQIGFDRTISYDHNATSGNKWNVPVGLFVPKTIKIGSSSSLGSITGRQTGRLRTGGAD